MKKFILLIIPIFSFFVYQNTFAETLIEDGTYQSNYSFLNNNGELITTSFNLGLNPKVYTSSGSYYLTPIYSTGGTDTQNNFFNYHTFDYMNYKIIMSYIPLGTGRNTNIKIFNKLNNRYYLINSRNILSSLGYGTESDGYIVFSNNTLLFGKNGFKWIYIDFSILDNPEFSLGAGIGVTDQVKTFISPFQWNNASPYPNYQFIIDNLGTIRTCNVNSNMYNAYSWTNYGLSANHGSITIPSSNGISFGTNCFLVYDNLSSTAGFSYHDQTTQKLNYSLYIPGTGFQQGTPDKYIDNFIYSGSELRVQGFGNSSGINYTKGYINRQFINGINSGLVYYRQTTQKSGCSNSGYCIYTNFGNDNILNSSSNNNNINISNNNPINLNPTINNTINPNINITLTGSNNGGGLNDSDKGFFGGIFGSGGVFGGISNAIGGIGDKIQNTFSSIGNFFGELGDKISNSISGLVSNFTSSGSTDLTGGGLSSISYDKGTYSTFGTGLYTYTVPNLNDSNINNDIDLKTLFTSCPSGLQDIDIGFFNFLNWGIGPYTIPIIKWNIQFRPFIFIACPVKSFVNSYNMLRNYSLNPNI